MTFRIFCDQLKCPAQVGGRLEIAGTRKCPTTRDSPPPHSLGPALRLGVVMGNQLRLGIGDLRKRGFEDLADAQVQIPASDAQ